MAGGHGTTVTAGSGMSTSPVPSVTVPCPLTEFELVELVEVVKQDATEKWVKGAAMDTTAITEQLERMDKDAANFKQYINLDRDLEGTDKRHPEYGREIAFKARIKQKDGKTDKLAGVKVKFSNKRTDGPGRSNPGGGDPDVWSGADLTGDQKEGFGSKGGLATTVGTTDDKGWTAPVSFFLSMYGGDKFKIEAELDPGEPGAGPSPIPTPHEYVVWRKFWYQMTYADGFAAVQPTEAEKAYAEVFAEMVKANEKKFVKNDFTLDLRERTFLKEYQLKDGGADVVVGNIGVGNIGDFTTNVKLKMATEPEHKPKGNLIICEYQCDPKGTSALEVHPLTANNQEITIDTGTGGPIVSKPALKAGADLVVVGEWGTVNTPAFVKRGNITDANIKVEHGRSSTKAVKVSLPGGAPAPTVLAPVYVKLKVETSKGFLGWATAAGTVAVYRPTVGAGKSGSKEDFNDTVAHEFGHKFNQTPKPAAKPASMKDHPLQYVGHHGSGSHCRHDAKYAVGVGNVIVGQNANTTIAVKVDPAGDTHEVASTAGFMAGHKVEVDGVEKTLDSKLPGSKLKFTTNFTSEVAHTVKQKLTYGVVDWQNANQKFPYPYQGDCMMYHSFSERCSHKFCKTCKPYLQLQDMSSL